MMVRHPPNGFAAAEEVAQSIALLPSDDSAPRRSYGRWRLPGGLIAATFRPALAAASPLHAYAGNSALPDSPRPRNDKGPPTNRSATLCLNGSEAQI